MKLKKLFSTLALLLMVLIPSTAFAADNINLEISGTVVSSPVAPVLENGTTLVPIRIVSEYLGAEVLWDGDNHIITILKDDNILKLKINDTTVSVNGKTESLSVAPRLSSGTTMVPIRFVSDNLGVHVNWDSASNTVQISETNSFTKPETQKASDTIKPLTVKFIDVGQADCALLTCDGEALLIDAGNTGDAQKIFSIIKNSGITNFKAIIVTHAHEDHCGGIAAALSAATADVVYAPVTQYDSDAFQNILKKTTLTVPKTGTTISLGSATVEILGPTKQYDEPNNTSIVCKVTNGNDSFLFTGDMESDAERDLIESGADLTADVLKVGHHGSDTSSSYYFLREVMPTYAVISVGEANSYGHPTETVLSRLHDADIMLFRTDLQGDITATSSGDGISFRTANKSNVNVWTSPTSNITDSGSYTPSSDGYIGNKNSKVFHDPSCRSLPAEKNRVYFELRSSAVDAGYRPCGNCNP